MLRRLSMLMGAAFLVVYLLSVNASAIQSQQSFKVTVPSPSITVTGYSSPNSLIIIKDNGQVVATTSSNNLGQFSQLVSNRIVGIRNISVESVDLTGNQSQSVSKNVSIQPQQNTIVTFTVPPTISITSSAVSIESSIQVTGYTVPSSTVKLNTDGTEYSNITSNSSGFYQFIIAAGTLGIGEHSLQTYVNSPLEQSKGSKTIKISVLPKDQAPNIDIIVTPNIITPPIISSPDDGVTIQGNQATITGTAGPNSQINIYINGELSGSVFANQDGDWAFTLTATSSPLIINAESCIDGKCSVRSKSITLYFDSLIQCNVAFGLEQYRYWGIRENEAFIVKLVHGDGSIAQGITTIEWGDGRKEILNLSPELIELPSKYTEAGNYNGSIAIDNDGCRDTRYFSVSVEEHYEDNSLLPIIFSLSVLAMSIVLARYIKKRKDS